MDAWLDRIASGLDIDEPTIITLHAHDHILSLGVGLPGSFVQVQPESGDPPYLVTVGDPNADDVVTFMASTTPRFRAGI
jgi:hypothetical protein